MDTTAPVLVSNLEEEIYVGCEDIPEIPLLMFVDNCTSNVDLVYSEDINTLDEFSYDIIRNWIAFDNCGNQTDISQTIYVRRLGEFDDVSTSLCINDDPIDLRDFITNTDILTGDGWGITSFMEGSIFNPSNANTGTYEFQYTYYENQCEWTTIVTILVHDDCFSNPCIVSADDVKISKLVSANNDGYEWIFLRLLTV